jgi:Cytidylate kinase-like family
MAAVVTISRQYGAGGRSIGPAVAGAIGFRFVDPELTEEAARRLGLDPEVAGHWDERAPAIVEELGMALAASAPPFAGVPGPAMGAPDERELADATRRIILSMAESGGYVILGRGGQAALRDRPDACHLSLVGDIKDRARRVMTSQAVSEKEALAMCERVDAERAGYVKRFYGVDIREPTLYDSMLNTSRLGIEGSIEISVAVCRRRLGLP